MLESLPNLVETIIELEDNDSNTVDYTNKIWDFMDSLYNVVSMKFNLQRAKVRTCYVFHALTLLSLIKWLNTT